MNALTTFSFDEQAVRVLDRNDAPWFVAVDVCNALGISNSRDAVAKLDDDEKGVGSTDTLRGSQQVTIINEGGLYTLVLRCRDAMTPGTVPYRFRKWVTGEVLPAIRRTGRYEGAPPRCPTMSVAAMLYRVPLIREYRLLYGMEGGRWLIEQLGMPRPPPEVMEVIGGKPMLTGFVPDSVNEWVEECVERHPDAKQLAGALYRSYQEWCAEKRRVPETQTAFGRALSRLNFAGFKSGSGNIWRRGLKLLS